MKIFFNWLIYLLLGYHHLHFTQAKVIQEVNPMEINLSLNKIKLEFPRDTLVDQGEPIYKKLEYHSNHVLVDDSEEILSEYEKTENLMFPSRFASLVNFQNGIPILNPIFKENLDFIIQSNLLSYQVGNIFANTKKIPLESDPIYALFHDNGWITRPFEGVTGHDHPDLPGVFLYNIHRNVLIIAFHGTITAHDWITNHATDKVDQELHGLPVKGFLHRGYAKKVKKFEKQFFEVFDELYHSMSSENKSQLIIFLTGHSQGAALALLAGITLIHRLTQDSYFGRNYSNSIQNRVQFYRLSAPRTSGDKKAHDSTSQYIGELNDIRHNVFYDPIANFPLGLLSDRLFWPTRFFTNLFSNRVGYRSNGVLAIQKSSGNLWKSLRKDLSEAKEHPKRTFFLIFMKALKDSLGALHFCSMRYTEQGCEPVFDGELVVRDLESALVLGKQYSTN